VDKHKKKAVYKNISVHIIL